MEETRTKLQLALKQRDPTLDTIFPEFDKITKNETQVIFSKRDRVVFVIGLLLYNNMMEEAEIGYRYRGTNVRQ